MQRGGQRCADKRPALHGGNSYHLQPVVDAWLQDGDNASALPVSLKLVLSTLDEAMARKAGGPVALNFTALLRKAKEKSVRVVGIDGGATPTLAWTASMPGSRSAVSPR